MASFEEFAPLVNSFVPNVPPFVVAKAGQQCVQDFFSRTTEMQDTLTVQTVVGERHYTLTPLTADTYVNHVLSVVDDEDKHLGYCESNNKLTLTKIPDKVKTLTVQVAVTPHIEATEIPDDVFIRHTMALRYGVIAILKFQTGTKWYSPNEAVNYSQMYEQEINQSKILQLTKNNTPSMQVPPFDI